LLFISFERIEIEQCRVDSSINRKKRTEEMKPPELLNDLFLIAYDQANQKYPIFRDPLVPGNLNSVGCISTGLFLVYLT